MSHPSIAAPRPHLEQLITSTSITKLTCYYDDAYDAIIERFRIQVPHLDVLRMRAVNSGDDLTRVIEGVNSPSGFVLFADYNHAGWMRHYAVQGQNSQRAHRFTFGNPLYALPVLQRSIEMALHIPLDCSVTEELDKQRTKLVAILPTSLPGIADDDETMSLALAEIEAKLLALVHSLAPQLDKN